MRIRMVVVVGIALVVLAAAWPHPLDEFERTGIRRLRAYQMVLDGTMPGNLRIPPGGRLPGSEITLRLAGINESFDIGSDTPRDAALQRGLEQLVAIRHPSYRMAILDITDPLRPRYAAVRSNQGYSPGSVGKLLVMTGLFHQLKKRYPEDVRARERMLRETTIVADEWAMPNSHAVPVVASDWTSVVHRAVRIGDEFTLWEWADHMVSPSSNAAGTMVWKHLMLMEHFGSRYPVSIPEQQAFFTSTPKADLSALAARVIEEPLLELGLDTAQLKLRTFFSRGAGRVVPGGASVVTPGELVRWMIKLEQGKIVDRWSSLEMKKLIYFTRRRYRYAASRALDSSAVFFKSGSLFRCQPEPGYECVQYKGNRQNLMHSVAMIESPAGEPEHVYLVSMMSDVLKINSAQAHQEIAAQVERLVRSTSNQ